MQKITLLVALACVFVATGTAFAAEAPAACAPALDLAALAAPALTPAEAPTEPEMLAASGCTGQCQQQYQQCLIICGDPQTNCLISCEDQLCYCLRGCGESCDVSSES